MPPPYRIPIRILLYIKPSTPEFDDYLSSQNWLYKTLHSYSPCMSKFASMEKAQRNRHDINAKV
jgi:hypothetical protein